jgi:hypothetical protein
MDVLYCSVKNMPNLNPRLKQIFMDKPECVIDLPAWLLPSRKIDEYRAMTGLAIVEIAGRDSVAAAVKGVEEKGFTDLLPTYVYTGTEHGPWKSVETAVARLAERLPGVQVHDLIILGSPQFWQALNGRFVRELMARYKFYTPCVGCHLYLHSVRIPLSITLGKIPIVAGEREQHDGKIKLNQIAEALDVYENIVRNFGVPLVLPLRDIGEGDRIADILGFPWEAGKEQLGCVLSGNYRMLDESVPNAAPQVKRCLEDFVGPCIQKIIDSYVTGYVPDHLEIAASVLHHG